MGELMDPEAVFWRQRYLELLQNHTQIVALMVKQGQQEQQVQKLADLGKVIQERKEAHAAQEERTGQDAPSGVQANPQNKRAATRP